MTLTKRNFMILYNFKSELKKEKERRYDFLSIVIYEKILLKILL